MKALTTFPFYYLFFKNKGNTTMSKLTTCFFFLIIKVGGDSFPQKTVYLLEAKVVLDFWNPLSIVGITGCLKSWT